MKRRLIVLLGLLLGFGCKADSKSAPSAANEVPPKPALPAVAHNLVERADFNRLAAELHLPLFWAGDDNKDGSLDPAELAVLWGRPWPSGREVWLDGDSFTPKLEKAYAAIAKLEKSGHSFDGLEKKEVERRKLILEELNQGRATLVGHDFSKSSDREKKMIGHLLDAFGKVEQLYLTQVGAADFLDRLPDDPPSRAVFHRNHGPWCTAPRTGNNPACNALADAPPRISGMYPKRIQTGDPGFCEKLQKNATHEKLLNDHFAVVTEGPSGDLVARPYSEAYKAEAREISASLRAAAAELDPQKEGPFKMYLEAAAQSFVTNDWEPANEAWSKMNAQNSKWYLRVGPDEVYFEPCSQKAGFHVSFGLIDQGSLEWQQKLDPVKGAMEKALAARAGAPYKARDVSFHLPDFVDIVLNAGDSRSPHGATIGQSLPNWGAVANEGRGRTVAMTNFYTDPDSIRTHRSQTESLLCTGSMAAYTSEPGPILMSTVLHEAAHNLGPAHEYKVGGKTDSQAFGGPLASTLEELKAQTSALYFTDWLVDQKIIDRKLADQAHVRDLIWAFGHISRGMYTAEGKPKPYSQLASIQLRYLMKQGAIEWLADTKAANGTDKGCFEFHLDAFPAAIEKMMTEVAGIKARADKKAALAMKAELVDKDDLGKELLDVIEQRMLRAPKQSFVYSIRL